MDADDYWNTSANKSFSFDEETDDKFLDDVSEVSTKSSCIPLNLIISDSDLQYILDEEQSYSESIIPKGLKPEEEVKLLRRKINELQFCPIPLVVTKILMNKSCSLECYRTMQEKQELLEEAISCDNGDAILRVVLFLKNTLKPALFMKLIANQPSAVNHYVNHLATTMKIYEASEILMALERHHEAILLQFKVIVQSKNVIQKLEKLKVLQENLTKTPNNFLGTQIKNYTTLLEMQINERLYFQPHDILEKSVLETLYYACEKFPKFSDPTSSSSLTNPFKMCEEFNIAPAQFEWVALNQRARTQAWKDIEALFQKKSLVLKKKTFVISFPLEIAILRLYQLKAPQAVLNSFLQHVEDPERRLMLSKKVGAINSIIESLTILRNRSALEDFKESLPSGTAEYFYTEKAITSISSSSTKNLLGLRKNSSNTSTTS